MRIYDIIDKKKRGGRLSDEEIRFFVKAVTDGTIEDYQTTALLMAIWFSGMDIEETSTLTLAMAESGDTIDLSGIDGTIVDKHSTGGIGDKTTLVIGPVLAALGVPVAKMSGRGLGATGGTIDKLDSIPGFSSDMDDETFIRLVKTVGFVDAAQTKNLVPADKKLYALRDVTATVDSIPLIASSIMSKKLASGADVIVLDVKFGTGAFMTEYDDARLLAETMIKIGEACGRRTVAVLTDMNEPLGRAVGNSLEVEEAVEVLKGCGEERLTELCTCLAAVMLICSGRLGDSKTELCEYDHENNREATDAYKLESMMQVAKEEVAHIIESGAALGKLREFVRAQGGDDSFIDNADVLKKAKYSFDIISEKTGYIASCDATLVGEASCILGAGRTTKDDVIDASAGIKVFKKIGDFVKSGDVIATLYTDKEEALPEAEKRFSEAYAFSETPVSEESVVREILL